MKYKSLPEMKSKLQDIRSRLLGGIEKTIKTSQDEEFTQLIPDITDEASRSFSRQIMRGTHSRGPVEIGPFYPALRCLPEHHRAGSAKHPA